MILKNELAVQYFPDMDADSARRQLRKYLKEYQSLRQELILNGYSFAKRCPYFTPKEVEIIKKHLGEPA